LGRAMHDRAPAAPIVVIAMASPPGPVCDFLTQIKFWKECSIDPAFCSALEKRTSI
jgi:hypothetical protein